jgi:hypothetical protein
MTCYFYPARSAGWMTCYFRKYDRITVGAVILPKIPKIVFHNTNGYSFGVALNTGIITVILRGPFNFRNVRARTSGWS